MKYRLLTCLALVIGLAGCKAEHSPPHPTCEEVLLKTGGDNCLIDYEGKVIGIHFDGGWVMAE